MEDILKELEKYREKGYSYNLVAAEFGVDIIIWKNDVHLLSLFGFDTIGDGLKAILNYVYKIHRVPHRKRVKL